MSCASCGSGADGKPGGCNSNGGCASGGCNRRNTYDWITAVDIQEPNGLPLMEVSFKNGSRKDFFFNPHYTRASTGDMVVVETGNGMDVGKVTLTGELVRLQMKKRRVPEDADLHRVVRIANHRDLDRLTEAREMEMETLVRSRIIARNLGLEMKIGDIEYQGDKRKATFYYTAEGRVDFRELIRHYASEFRVKIEMRQIGARQESARIGGLGSCGRELCCSTWLSNFKSVSTSAARYQNLAINQAKLSGQCGRLKCCLNFELDTYMDALEDFPKNADKLYTEAGTAVLIKTNIFKRLMYYVYQGDGFKGKFYVLSVDTVIEILEMNTGGKKPVELMAYQMQNTDIEDENEFVDADDLTGVIELPPEERRKRNSRNRNKNKGKGGNNRGGKRPDNRGGNTKSKAPRGPRKDNKGDNKEGDRKPNDRKRSNNRNRNKTNNRSGNKPNNGSKSEKDTRPPRNKENRKPRPPRNKDKRPDRKPDGPKDGPKE